MVDIPFKFRSLEDFLIGSQLSLDGQIQHGAVFNFSYQVKAREINAVILFADISLFSHRTKNLTSTQTLLFVNQFFSFVSLAALNQSTGIVDKYIGDEIMVVFSKEFGAKDPTIEAIQTARWIAEFDPFQFCPHMGIASGLVTVGYVGSPIKYNCSVFGQPVTLASRCAKVSPEVPARVSISFPVELWENYDFDQLFPKVSSQNGDERVTRPHAWELREPRNVDLKGFGETGIRQILNTSFVITSFSIEESMVRLSEDLKRAGYYHPRTEIANSDHGTS